MPTSMFTWSSDQKNHQPASNHEKTLAECCEQKRSCRFLMVHNGYSAKANFASFHPHEVTLLVEREEDAILITQAICCVSFPHSGSYCAFLSNLIEVAEHDRDYQNVTLSVPKQLVTTNLRQSFRVPVLPEAQFEATIFPTDDQSLAVTAIDVAQAGLEIEMLNENDAALSVGSIVSTELRLNGETVRRPCEVRRIVGRRVGLSFVTSPDDADLEMATTISSMVISLQQFWLRSRVK